MNQTRGVKAPSETAEGLQRIEWNKQKKSCEQQFWLDNERLVQCRQVQEATVTEKKKNALQQQYADQHLWKGRMLKRIVEGLQHERTTPGGGVMVWVIFSWHTTGHTNWGLFIRHNLLETTVVVAWTCSWQVSRNCMRLSGQHEPKSPRNVFKNVFRLFTDSLPHTRKIYLIEWLLNV